MPTVKIPPVLRPQTGGESQVPIEGSDVGEVLRTLADQHPGTSKQLFAEDGELNRYVNVYLNDEDVRVLDGLATSVGADDTPSMTGDLDLLEQQLAALPFPQLEIISQRFPQRDHYNVLPEAFRAGLEALFR